MESWLASDTIRRMGFGHVIAARQHTLIVERGVSFAAFDERGRAAADGLRRPTSSPRRRATSSISRDRVGNRRAAKSARRTSQSSAAAYRDARLPANRLATVLESSMRCYGRAWRRLRRRGVARSRSAPRAAASSSVAAPIRPRRSSRRRCSGSTTASRISPPTSSTPTRAACCSKQITERGRLLVKKPGKMRWDYTAPGAEAVRLRRREDVLLHPAGQAGDRRDACRRTTTPRRRRCSWPARAT